MIYNMMEVKQSIIDL